MHSVNSKSVTPETVDDQDPRPLFHYTSTFGVKGILTNRVLRASVIHYLNDALEFEYALTVARDILAEWARQADEADRAACERVVSLLNTIRHINVCIFSLSEEGDLLSQWRAYCPLEGGYAIGFDTKRLGAITAKQGFRLLKCVYQEAEHAAALKPLLRPLVSDLKDAQGSDKPLKPWQRYRNGIATAAATIKHPSFSEEREWRLVCEAKDYTDPQMSHRATEGLIIPYFNIALADARIPINTIRIGPNRHTDLASRSIRGLLFSQQLQHDIKILESDTPFRVLG